MIQRQYTTILGAKIVEQETGEELAVVYDLIIDPETGKLEAFWVNQGFFSGAEKILSLNDVIEWKIKVYIQDTDVFINPAEILKIKEIIKKKIPIFMHKVKTLSGSKLGRVIDIFFDPITNKIIQIQIAKSLLGLKYAKRLIPFSEIYQITREAVFLKDEYKFSSIKVEELLDLSEAV